MKRFSSSSVLILIALSVVLTMHSVAAAPELPNPVLNFIGAVTIETGGKHLTRYYFDVSNKDVYPADMFGPAPDLPPCGANQRAARTWVDIYEHHGKRLNGFCALSKSADLEKIWFELESDVVPPSWVYIELNDRKSNTKYRSNLAETTL